MAKVLPIDGVKEGQVEFSIDGNPLIMLAGLTNDSPVTMIIDAASKHRELRFLAVKTVVVVGVLKKVNLENLDVNSCVVIVNSELGGRPGGVLLKNLEDSDAVMADVRRRLTISQKSIAV